MTKKKMISILLVVISLLSFCSFSVCAADETFTVSAMHSSMYTETDTGSGINIKNYDFVDGTETHGGILLHWFSAVDRNFYNAGSNKVVSTYDYSNLVAGHEYELIFNTYLNIMSDYTIVVKLGLGNVVFEQKIPKSGYVQKVTAKFVAPDVVTNSTRLTIELTCDSNQSYGSNSQDMQVKYMISEKVELTDLTENPSWLGKILQKFSDLGESIRNLGTTIGRFFTDLGERIGGFFSDLLANIKQKFDDLKTWIDGLGENIKQWFIDLGNDISEFFTMLKNYLLYFQHPVTVNADGVLIGKDGKPVYTNPFDSAIDKVKETVDDWLSKINDFVDGMEQSRLDVTGYLESGTGVINKVLKASPILTACVVFAVGFLVIRKVVGR